MFGCHLHKLVAALVAAICMLSLLFGCFTPERRTDGRGCSLSLSTWCPVALNANTVINKFDRLVATHTACQVALSRSCPVTCVDDIPHEDNTTREERRFVRHKEMLGLPFLNHWWRIRLSRSQSRSRLGRRAIFSILYYASASHNPVLFGEAWDMYYARRYCCRKTWSISARRRLRRSISLTGGGDTQKDVQSPTFFHYTDLIPYADRHALTLLLAQEWWQFSEYTSSNDDGVSTPQICLRLPLSVVASKLRGVSLQRACAMHGILNLRRTKGHGQAYVLDLAARHVCARECLHIRALFAPTSTSLPDLQFKCTTAQVQLYAQSEIGSDIEAIAVGAKYSFLSHAPISDSIGPRDLALRQIVPCRLPLKDLVSSLPYRVNCYIAFRHGIYGGRADSLIMQLSEHVCSGPCEAYITYVKSSRRLVRIKSDFPPEPLSTAETLRIIEGFCSRLDPVEFEEDGCLVCARLTSGKDLQDVSEIVLNMINSILRVPLYAPVERTALSRPQCYNDGPIVAGGCTKICRDCKECLEQGRLPKFALANGMWVGDVPEQLKTLSYAEKMLIARSRHHKCVVRVASSGMGKLQGNIICYPNPFPKLYSALPPHRDDIDELLAIVFTGIARPLDADVIKRIPFLVRRNRVRNALEWLRLNNCLYKDVDISESNLNSYADDAIPIVVTYNEDTTRNPVESRAANDTEDSGGTSSDECPFSVNGVAFDVFDPENISRMKAIALRHMTRDNAHALAVPHRRAADTLWHNHDLFPNMFPWLFPYGIGGICNADIRGAMSEHAHKRHLLMYYDKRFQIDREFALIAFNQEQILAGSTAGAFLRRRPRFQRLTDMILRLDQGALSNLTERLIRDPRTRPESEEEHQCFSVLGELDMVNGHVPGSVTAKRYQRHELWSLLAYKGAPTWFITFAPADASHPLCLYFAGSDRSFSHERLSLLSGDSKRRLIANNAVASARFFHYIVKIFLEEILRWDAEGQGLFGSTSAYYSTVEQQGRLTLHLHLLLWVLSALSPEEIRKRLLDPNSDFQRKMIRYIDAAHQGHLIDSTLRRTRTETNERMRLDDDYIAPTKTFPVIPFCNSDWPNIFRSCANDLLHRLNWHSCGDHCYRKKGILICKSRFPRRIVPATYVDETGHIHVRHDEHLMNTVNPVLTYLLRCNTDVTCLLSGTSLKAVIAYATDYITKVGLKTPSMFQLVRMQFSRSDELLQSNIDRSEKGRKIITGIINSFTSKSEIGSPMAASYLLDLPDHYTSHEFKPIYWKSFVSEVLSDFPQAHPLLPNAESADDVIQNDYQVVVTRGQVLSGRVNLVAVSPITDYIYRPREHENYCVYDWIRLFVKTTGSICRQSSSSSLLLPKSKHGDCTSLALGQGSADTTVYAFCTPHEQERTHGVFLDCDRANIVPNFIGGALPRRDKGDREYYCCTMLTLFKPWRQGTDLKTLTESWDAAFVAWEFSSRQIEVMAHFNLRYECLDARDDFSNAQAAAADPTDSDDAEIDETDPSNIQQTDEHMVILEDEPDSWDEPSEHARRMVRQAGEVTRMLQARGWTLVASTPHISPLPQSLTLSNRSRLAWSQKLEAARAARNLKALLTPVTPPSQLPTQQHQSIYIGGLLRPIDRHQLASMNGICTIAGKCVDVTSLVNDVAAPFSLNAEQMRAYRLVVEHFGQDNQDQLCMYLGGMAGTGKSQVIRAVTSFFQRMGSTDCVLLLAPTGTAAANIGGYTYHSAFGLNPHRSGAQPLNKKSRELLALVRYIILDEVSMLSCGDMKNISEMLSRVHHNQVDPFGGFNIIFAGDFAQLPPVGGKALFDCEVGFDGKSQLTQRAALGRMLWHQVTTVVILRENMRQIGMSAEDKQFRRALENMRYKACTDNDIRFLQTLIVNPDTPDNRLLDWRFRHVSVITGLNAHRDAINTLGCEKFARDTGQSLEEFHSVDSVGEGEEDLVGHKKKGKKTWLTSLPPRTRETLWQLTHFASDNVPGVLSLCKGMPIIIKKNQATECGVTNGGEGVVIDWISKPLQGGKQALDVLFVRLTNENLEVLVEGLPDNVVPLCAESDIVICKLPNDRVVSVRREQVRVLPNFAMTDYASQGKTRPYNVVDLFWLKSHQAYYTALSRGATADGTIILQRFRPAKIQGGLSADLKAEFRDLEFLDEITRLEAEGALPESVTAKVRYARIAQYLRIKGARHQPLHLHPALTLTRLDVERLAAKSVWTVMPKHSAPPKRAAETCEEELSSKRSHQSRPVVRTNSGLTGMRWDAINYSCAYDACFTALYQMWKTDMIAMSNFLLSATPISSSLLRVFHDVSSEQCSPEAARDAVRQQLWRLAPETFPYGRNGCQVVDVATYTLSSEVQCWQFHIDCPSCGRVYGPFRTAGLVWQFPDASDIELKLRHTFLVDSRRSTCCGELDASAVKIDAGPCVVACWTGSHHNQRAVNPIIRGETTQWNLDSAIYHGHFHFVMRRQDNEGRIWFYDGRQNDGRGQFEAHANAIEPAFWSARRTESGDNFVLALALYRCQRVQ